MAEGSTLKSNPNPVVFQPAAVLRTEGDVSDTLVAEIFGELEQLRWSIICSVHLQTGIICP